MLAFGFLWSIDADKTDGNLLAINDNSDGVTVGDSNAPVLASKDNGRKDEDGYNEDNDFKVSGGHQDAFHALPQMTWLTVEGVTPYFWASWS